MKNPLYIALVLLACETSKTAAQPFVYNGFSDISPRTSASQIVTDAFDDSTASIVPNVRVFEYQFQRDPLDPYYTQDPGFNALHGFLPANSTLNYSITSSLSYWNGVGAVALGLPPASEALQFKLGSAANTRTVTGSSGVLPDSPVGNVNSLGALHRHLNAFLLAADGNAIPGDGSEATPGVYFANFVLKSTSAGIANSDTKFLVYGNGATDAAFFKSVKFVRDNFAPGTNLSNVNSNWIVNANGAWETESNWTGGVPEGVSVQATLGGAISAPRTVTVGGAHVIGTLSFDSSSKYTVAGSGTLNFQMFSGARAGINVFSGSHDVAASINLLSDLSVTVRPGSSTLRLAGDLTSSSPVSLIKSAQGTFGGGTLEVKNLRTAGVRVDIGSLKVIPDGGDASASNIATLAIASNATLDLADNDLIVRTTPVASVRSWITQARNDGAWDQPGLTSSAASASSGATTLGLLTGSEYLSLGLTGFDGFPVAPTDTLVKHTWYGDTDFNGVVDFDDYVRIDNGFNAGLSGWFNGDFDLNGVVDFDDYVLIDFAFNSQNGTLSSAVPEPASASLFVTLWTIALSRRVARTRSSDLVMERK